MASMSADVWVAQQETEIQAVLSWTPSSGLPAPTQHAQARTALLRANLPMYRATVTTLGIVGWAMIGGSLLLIILAALQPRKRPR